MTTYLRRQSEDVYVKKTSRSILFNRPHFIKLCKIDSAVILLRKPNREAVWSNCGVGR